MELVPQEAKIVRSTEVTMPCRLGLHARTATRFILFAKQFRSRIRIIKVSLLRMEKAF